MFIATRIYAAAQSFFAPWQTTSGVDFDHEYSGYLHAITGAGDRRAFDLATMALVAKLTNGHTWYGDWWLRRRDGQGLGFYAHPIDGKWVVTESAVPSPAIGDVIERIGDTPIAEFYEANKQYMFASDERWRERSLFEHPYLFPKTFNVTLAGGRTSAVTRSKPFQFHGDGFAGTVVTRTDGVVVIVIPSFSRPAFEDSAVAALRANGSAAGVVVDLRGNHGGAVPNKLIRALMDRPYAPATQITPAFVGMFRSWGAVGAHPIMGWANDVVQPQKPLYTGPLVILTDGGCYSACEETLMPFADTHRATVVGEQTAGSSGQTYVVDLGDGMAVGINTVVLRRADGAPFEGVGIPPDVVVHRSAEDWQRGRDPALDSALSIVRRKRSAPK